ncbi:hypothetical protein HKD37_13G036566 [Glycine soja]
MDKEFKARLSQTRFGTASSVGESQLTPLDFAEEQRLKTRCWVAATRSKRKGHFYNTRDIALLNVEMTTSCNIHKDLPDAL